METKRIWKPALWIGATLLSAFSLSADSITFSLLPASGNVSGASGSLVGWGYSLTNNSAADWFLATALNSDSFSHGTPTSLFDFPDLGPGQTVTEAFNAVNSVGLFQLFWDTSAPTGFVNQGDFVLSGQWWNGDPFNGGTVVADATDVALPYSAAVAGKAGTVTPEPAGFLLVMGGLAAVTVFMALEARRRTGK